MKCRHCAASLDQVFIDLGSAPPSNAYLSFDSLSQPERWYPLRVLVCHSCWLVQTQDFAEAGDLFDADYAYFSGFSSSWLHHCEASAKATIRRFSLKGNSYVVEVAANDGCLLQYYKAAGIPCLGIEPTASTAAAARAKGIEIVGEFFGAQMATELVQQGKTADLIIANNVLAHVPDINDFVAGVQQLLKPTGIAVFEFPHLMRLVERCQFDTVYHEHFSYLSLTTVLRIFGAQGLNVFDVDELSTHGGSLRVFAQQFGYGQQPSASSVSRVQQQESQAGISTITFYETFQSRAERVKNDFLEFLLTSRRAGKRVCAYGAAAKGNTLLNFAGVRSDLLEFVADANPAKQGKYLPGSRIPIVAPAHIETSQPEYIVVFPWNLYSELSELLTYTRNWGARLVTAIPSLCVR